MRACLPLTLALLVLPGCRRSEAPKTPAPSTKDQTTAVQGTLLERIDVPPYSYLRLKTAGGEVWAAVEQNSLANGATVTIRQAMLMTQWQSPQLKRTFDRLYLGNLGDGPAASGAPNPHGGMGMPAGHPAPGAAPTAVKVPKAEGPDARTVAEVFAQRTTLDGKTVAVRGTVVRAAAGISMPGIKGSTWVHLQDGTGAAAEGTHDLTITTDAAVKPGEVVTLRGIVSAKPQDVMGSSRPVMVQDAKVIK